jgi:NADPH2:quinone reductase
MNHAAANRAMIQELLAMPGIDPVAPERRPLEEAGQAMDDLINRRVTGKIVLVPAS